MIKHLVAVSFASAVLSGAAVAADLPSRSAPPAYPVAPTFTWTGFYAGTTTGYSFSDRQNVRTFGNDPTTVTNVALLRRPPTFRVNQDGFASLSGGIGYDYQLNPGNGFVIGVAADASWTDLDRRRTYISPPQPANAFIPEFSNFRQELDYLGTVRGRVGYAFDRFLVYGTGGFAYGNVVYRANFYRSPDVALVYSGRYEGMQTGYVYGGGVEWAIPTDSFLNSFNLLSYLNLFKSDGITLKAEYLHYDLGSRNVIVNAVLPGGPVGSYTSRFSTEGNLIRGGFTYRFGTLGF